MVIQQLRRLQKEKRFNELNEKILEYEERGGNLAKWADFFEQFEANSEYAEWHRQNSCGYDEIESPANAQN